MAPRTTSVPLDDDQLQFLLTLVEGHLTALRHATAHPASFGDDEPLTVDQLEFIQKLVQGHMTVARQMPGDNPAQAITWARRLADLLTEAIRTSDDT
jgi:hypothetical protein